MIRKRWCIYWISEAAALTIYLILTLISGRFLVICGALLVILSVIWLIYYYRLKYSASGGMINISAGIIFRRYRRLPPENILWTMRLSFSPIKGAIMTVLHTSGGRAVIFGDISTVC